MEESSGGATKGLPQDRQTLNGWHVYRADKQIITITYKYNFIYIVLNNVSKCLTTENKKPGNKTKSKQ